MVLATGCVEQPMVFRNNDLPGVMLASAAQRLMRLWGVSPGRQAVVVTANPEGYAAALDLLDAGVALQAVLDLRAEPGTVAGRDELVARGVRGARRLDRAPRRCPAGPGRGWRGP